MLIDQDAGSGGDYLPYGFSVSASKLIGTCTWGGLIGISANPSLIDGGFSVPFSRVLRLTASGVSRMKALRSIRTFP